MEFSGRRMHFMGVGGIGMSALAEWAHARGARVSGCDRAANAQTDRLRALGVEIAIGHDPVHARGQELFVYTSAVPADHPERRAATAQAETLCLRRGSFLSACAGGMQTLGVCGTHGKTTTTWILAHLLIAGDLDPTVVLGGTVEALGGNLRLGAGPHLVTELDESDGSFLEPALSVAVLTNVESEHLHHWGDEAAMLNAYRRWLAAVTTGAVVLHADDPGTQSVAEAARGEVLRIRVADGSATTAGAATAEERPGDPAIELQAGPSRPADGAQAFPVWRRGEPWGEVRLPLPGRHNVANALQAAAAALAVGVAPETIRAALATCPSVDRRMQLLGQVEGARIYTDYAHHPTEVAAAIAGARELAQGPVVVIFQPHLYSRTRDYAEGFGTALATADQALLVDLYPAREEPLPGIDSGLLVETTHAAGGKAAGPYTLAAAAAAARPFAKPGAVLIFMGAGDIPEAAAALLGSP